jgi:predicted GTPase
MLFRNNPLYRAVAFTAAQIPDIAGRAYPPALAGRLYPRGIPISPEEELPNLIKKHRVDYVYLSYSDLPHLEVMHKASIALAAGANFALLGPAQTSLTSKVPVISVGAVRTGAGKSPTSRRVVRFFKERGYRIVAIRHPMPYGDLERQVCQRFATYRDLDRHHCTIEEREEYEPFLRMGTVVYAGVDYRKILRAAEQEADLLLWDGGNNDFPFIRSDFHIVLLDPHRPGHELAYHPGEVNFRMADLFIINKVDSAPPEQVESILKNVKAVRPSTPVVKAELSLVVDRPELIKGKRVLIVEDGPTLTHGGMAYGAGTLAAQRFGASQVVDGRTYAVGSLKEVLATHTHLHEALPAMGYSPQQVQDLEATIHRAPCDVVIDATPTDLARLLHVDKPIVNVEYELREQGRMLFQALRRFEKEHLR